MTAGTPRLVGRHTSAKCYSFYQLRYHKDVKWLLFLSHERLQKMTSKYEIAKNDCLGNLAFTSH